MSLIRSLKQKAGFTLIELLVVIGILTILLAIVLVALNPAQHFADANDTKRRSDVNAILNGVHAYMAKNGGNAPAGITTTAKTVTDAAGVGNVDLCGGILVPSYIADLPVDPSTGTKTPANSICSDTGADYNTGYTIVKSATDSRITVSATSSSGGTITVTR